MLDQIYQLWVCLFDQAPWKKNARKDGLISFEEFKEGVKDLDVAEQLTMDVSPS